MAPFLDGHLVFKLLASVDRMNDDTQTFKKADLLNAQISLIAKTKMVDYEIELRESAGETISAETKARQLATQNEYQHQHDDCEAILGVVQPRDAKKEHSALRYDLAKAGNFNKEYLEAEYQVDADQIEGLYELGKFIFECGDYASSVEYLSAYRLLIADPKKGRGFSALWGKLAAEILNDEWAEAERDVHNLQEIIDRGTKDVSQPELLQQRTWLIHWSLFVFLARPQARSGLVIVFPR